MNAPGLDPITKLHKALKASERMKGVDVELGAREEPPECSTPRICVVPVGGPLGVADHSGNVADLANQVRFDCLAKDPATLHEVIRRLLCAVNDYTREIGDSVADETADGVSDCIRWDKTGNVEYDDERDTNRQGAFAEVTLPLTISFEKTLRSTDGSTGTVLIVTVRKDT